MFFLQAVEANILILSKRSSFTWRFLEEPITQNEFMRTKTIQTFAPRHVRCPYVAERYAFQLVGFLNVARCLSAGGPFVIFGYPPEKAFDDTDSNVGYAIRSSSTMDSDLENAEVLQINRFWFQFAHITNPTVTNALL